MEAYKIQLVETAIALLVFFAIKFILRRFVQMTVVHSYFKTSEKKDVLKIINLILTVGFGLIAVAIWSVKQENILLVASSLLTVFGVAMFTEMSILSNITACLILFFQHPIKVGDTITMNYEGSEIEGELIDITYFFVFIQTTQRGTVSVPNSVFLRSPFHVLEKKVDEIETLSKNK